MTDPARRQHLLVNLRSQPMEIHRGVDVLVLPPRGRVELLDSDLALPQLHALLARRQVAILEWNAPPDAATSANWTMVGICAHESAMKGGERVKVPEF